MPSLQRAIAAAEYQVSENAHGLQAPNRAHQLRSYFDDKGVRVHDRLSQGEEPLVSLRLTGLQRGDTQLDVGLGEVTSHGTRVEIRRPGLVEWYDNSPAGLEQGFTIEQPLEGDGPLWLDMVVEGASARANGEHVEIATAQGRRLRYGGLVVVDAVGRMLEASLEVPDDSKIRVVLADAGAVYPVTIDPLLTSFPDAFIVSDQANAQVGYDVAGAGDVNGDGYADVIVGAPRYDAGEPEEGVAFVFLGSASGAFISEPIDAHAQLESNQSYSKMGARVASAGDVNGDGYADVIVGAPFYYNGPTGDGAAFVFLGSATGIADADPSTAHARFESKQAISVFGSDVAGAGDVNGDGYGDIIIGAQAYDSGEVNEGAAFVFLGSASGLTDGDPGTAHARFEGNQLSAQLGVSVDGAGDVNGDGYADVIVGAETYSAGESGEGAAFIFLGSAAGMVDGDPSTADTQLESNQASAKFGCSVAGAGDVDGDGYADVIVGSSNYDLGQIDEGFAFIFRGSASGIADGGPNDARSWLQSNQNGAWMGSSVAGAGDVNGDGYADVIVGAEQYDGAQIDEGAAFVFMGSPALIADGDPTTAHTLPEVDEAGALFGASVAGVGDVNGNGYADLIVGAYSLNAGATVDLGAAFVFEGRALGVASGDPTTAHATFQSDQTGSNFGWSVASAGDVNGDGYGDVIIGAPEFDAGESDEGAAFVFHGGATGIAGGNPLTANGTLESNQLGAAFGKSVASAGDVNGDGYADVIVGAWLFNGGESDEGAAFVFLGSAAGIVGSNPSTAHATLESDQAGAYFGGSVASAGDVNGDGYADVIVGADRYEAGEPNEGAAFVFLGSAVGVVESNPSMAHATLESDQVGAAFGRRVASAGDVNGDGYADVIVSAYPVLPGEADDGAAFVFLGSAAGIVGSDPSAAHAVLESDQARSLFGVSVAGAGDVNGDGYADVIVGASSYDAGGPDEGAAFVYLGNSEGRPVLATQHRGDPSADCATLPDWAAPPSQWSYFTDEAAWTVAANAAAGSVEAFETTPANIAKANEVATPPVQNTWVPPLVTFDRANTGLCPSFTLETLQSGAWFTYDDGEPSPATWPEGYLSIGDINDYENDDFRITFTDNKPYAVAFYLVDNDNSPEESIYVQAGGGVTYLDVGSVAFPAKSNEGAFVGFVAPAPIDSITFDESPDGDDVGLRDLLLAPAGAPLRAAPWTKSGSNDGFSVDILASHPDGTGRVKVEFEACPTGLAFGDPNCTTAVSPSWEAVDGANPEVRIGHTFTGLSLAELYRWRARTLYAAASEAAPIVPQHGPWRRHTAQAREADIRVPEPTVGLLFASGVAGLVALARRRNRRR